MADDIDSDEEERNMEDEFQWLLKAEVHGVLRQLNVILEETGRRFNIPGTGKDTLIKPETFVLSSTNGTDYVKGIVTLVGDMLCKADLTLRPHRNTNQLVKTYVRDDMPWRLQQKIQPNCKDTLIKPETFVLSSTNGTDYVKGIVTLVGDMLCKADLTLRPHRNTNQLVKTYVRDDMPWRLQQVQDVGNHIYSAIEIINTKDVDYEFQSAEEVNKLMDEILSQLMRARQRFLNPLIPSLQELYHSRYTKSLTPPLPHESMVNFYILGTKLVLHTYYLHPLALPKAHNQKGLSSSESKSRLLDLGPIKYELFSQNTVECAVPWVEEVTACLAFAMQLCQELKDKVSVFACCWDEYR
eukprot:XP_011660990.1 PREDICTED: protein rogdi homolog [Strongylocentrotus purpuratus]